MYNLHLQRRRELKKGIGEGRGGDWEGWKLGMWGVDGGEVGERGRQKKIDVILIEIDKWRVGARQGRGKGEEVFPYFFEAGYCNGSKGTRRGDRREEEE